MKKIDYSDPALTIRELCTPPSATMNPVRYSRTGSKGDDDEATSDKALAKVSRKRRRAPHRSFSSRE